MTTAPIWRTHLGSDAAFDPQYHQNPRVEIASFVDEAPGVVLDVALDVPLLHFSQGTVDAAWLEYDRRFRRKHARAAGEGEGRWLDVRRRVRSRDEVIAPVEGQVAESAAGDVTGARAPGSSRASAPSASRCRAAPRRGRGVRATP